MKLSLLSLLLSFVVFFSAVAALDVYGFLIAPVLLGIAAFIRMAASKWKACGCVMGYVCLLLFLLCLLAPFVSSARESARRASCMNNLKQLMLALHNYHETHGCFPPAHVSDRSGKPMHSWRTSLLPFMDRQDIYDKYNFEEPWDSVNNSKPAGPLPVLVCPSSAQQPVFTSYVAVVGTNTAWPSQKPLKLGDIPDAGCHTIMLIEAASSGIPWMEPRDLTVEEAIREIRSGPHLKENGPSYHDQAGANVAFADGSVHFLPADTPTETLEALLTINDGKTLPNIDVLREFPEPRPHWRNISALVVLIGSYALLLFRPRRRTVADVQHGQS